MEMCELCASKFASQEIVGTDQAAYPLMNIFEVARGDSLGRICFSSPNWNNYCSSMVPWLYYTGWKAIRLLSGDLNEEHTAMQHINLTSDTT